MKLCMGDNIDSKVSILLSIIFFILEYSSFDNSKYFSKQISIKYEQFLFMYLLFLRCSLCSFICSLLLVLIISKTKLLYNFIAK